MNKTIPTFCILIAVLLFSNCKKEEIICECDDSCISGEEIIDDTTGIPTFFPGNQEFGFFTAIKVNQMIEGSVIATRDTLNRNFKLLFSTFSTEGFRREELRISKIPFETGCYGITG